MSLSRRVARPMLASVFIVGGYQTAQDPDRVAKQAEPVAVPLAERIPGLPTDPVALVRINAYAQLGAGVLLAFGRFRRLASLVLLGSILPTTAAGHRFWEQDDDAARRQQQVHFLKNVGVAGGLLLSALDTDGAPSLGWRARRRAARTGAAVRAGRDSAGAAVKTGRESAGAALSAGRDSAGVLLAHAGDALPIG